MSGLPTDFPSADTPERGIRKDVIAGLARRGLLEGTETRHELGPQFSLHKLGRDEQIYDGFANEPLLFMGGGANPGLRALELLYEGRDPNTRRLSREEREALEEQVEQIRHGMSVLGPLEFVRSMKASGGIEEPLRIVRILEAVERALEEVGDEPADELPSRLNEDVLKLVRETRHLTVRAASEQTGIPRSTIHRYRTRIVSGQSGTRVKYR